MHWIFGFGINSLQEGGFLWEPLDIHIGEMLARNARMYPNDVALIERIPGEKKRREITWKQFDERGKSICKCSESKKASKRAIKSSIS